MSIADDVVYSVTIHKPVQPVDTAVVGYVCFACALGLGPKKVDLRP